MTTAVRTPPPHPVTPPTFSPVAPWPRTPRWTCDQFHRLWDSGALEGSWVILVDGEMLQMAAPSHRHDVALTKCTDWLRAAFAGPYWVRGQMGLALGVNTDPIPDVAVVAGRMDDHAGHPDHRRPRGRSVRLVARLRHRRQGEPVRGRRRPRVLGRRCRRRAGSRPPRPPAGRGRPIRARVRNRDDRRPGRYGIPAGRLRGVGGGRRPPARPARHARPLMTDSDWLDNPDWRNHVRFLGDRLSPRKGRLLAAAFWPAGVAPVHRRRLPGGGRGVRGVRRRQTVGRGAGGVQPEGPGGGGPGRGTVPRRHGGGRRTRRGMGAAGDRVGGRTDGGRAGRPGRASASGPWTRWCTRRRGRAGFWGRPRRCGGSRSGPNTRPSSGRLCSTCSTTRSARSGSPPGWRTARRPRPGGPGGRRGRLRPAPDPGRRPRRRRLHRPDGSRPRPVRRATFPRLLARRWPSRAGIRGRNRAREAFFPPAARDGAGRDHRGREITSLEPAAGSTSCGRQAVGRGIRRRSRLRFACGSERRKSLPRRRMPDCEFFPSGQMRWHDFAKPVGVGPPNPGSPSAAAGRHGRRRAGWRHTAWPSRRGCRR